MLGVWARPFRGFSIFACLVYGLKMFGFYGGGEKITLTFCDLFEFFNQLSQLIFGANLLIHTVDIVLLIPHPLIKSQSPSFN